MFLRSGSLTLNFGGQIKDIILNSKFYFFSVYASVLPTWTVENADSTPKPFDENWLPLYDW